MDSPLEFDDCSELLRHREWLDRVVSGMLGRAEDREDVIQETWVHAIRESRLLRDFRVYAATVARGLAANVRRSARRRAEREQLVARAELRCELDTAQLAERAELQRLLIAALLDLSEPQRSVLLLRFHGQLAVGEIASRLGMPGPTARSHLRRGLERLRSTFDRDPTIRNWRALLAPAPALRTGGGVLGGLLAGGVFMNLKGPVSAVAVLLLSAVIGAVLIEFESSSDGGNSIDVRGAAPIVVNESDLAITRDAVESESTEPATAHISESSESPKAILRGRLIYEESLAPVGDARIRESWNFGPPRDEVRTEHDGSFRITDLAVGAKLRFEVIRAGEVSSTFDLYLPSAGEHDVEFRIEPQVVVRGRVIDAETSEAIAGATVQATLNGVGDSIRQTHVTTDSAGGFEFRAPRRARNRIGLAASHDGYVATRLPSADSGDAVVPLLRAARIEGMVRRADGSAARNAGVRIAGTEVDASRLPAGWTWSSELKSPSSLRDDRADAEGRFVVDCVAPYSAVTLEAYEAGTEHVECVVKTEAPGSSRFVELTLPDPKGTAILEGVLSVNGKRGPVPYRLSEGTRMRDYRAANDGHFRHEALPGGDAVLWVDIPGVVSKSFRYELRAGTVTRADLDLRVDTSWVAGRVVRRDSSPIADLGVAIRAKDRDWCIGVKTDAAGHFRVLSALAGGEIAIARVHLGSAFHDFEIRGGDETITLEIPDQGKLRLRVIDRTTRMPIMSAAIRRVGPNGERREITPGSIRKLPGDLLELEMDAGTHRLEIDRTPTFYSAHEILAIVVAANEREFTEQLVELEPASLASVRLEFVGAGDGEASAELPRRPSVFWRRRGESVYSPLPNLAWGPSASEDELTFELPAGSIELAFGVARAGEPTVFLPAFELIPAESPHRIRVRKAPE